MHVAIAAIRERPGVCMVMFAHSHAHRCSVVSTASERASELVGERMVGGGVCVLLSRNTAQAMTGRGPDRHRAGVWVGACKVRGVRHGQVAGRAAVARTVGGRLGAEGMGLGGSGGTVATQYSHSILSVFSQYSLQYSHNILL